MDSSALTCKLETLIECVVENVSWSDVTVTQHCLHLYLRQDLLHLAQLLHQIREVRQSFRLTAKVIVVVVTGDSLEPLCDCIECVDLGWLDRAGQ